MHTTNYRSTLIEIAEDSPTTTAEVPPERASGPTLARRQFEMLVEHPYRYTSDDLIFAVHADKNGIPEADRPVERERFFSKGQPCLRTSPLARRYGWGIHHDDQERIALVPAGSEEYERLASDPATNRVKAMRSKRA
ncbi:MAG TPA: DUF6157 family protein [Thermomicrobiales bacterium]|nr:DUF6157 family protein [Thermomicrobiales bacterium]